jgi:signal transduction histidine kinase/CheY-like chemotaxis protein
MPTLQQSPGATTTDYISDLFLTNSVFVIAACLALVWLSWQCWRQHREPFLVLWMLSWTSYLVARAVTMVQIGNGHPETSHLTAIALSTCSQTLYYLHVVLTMAGAWCAAKGPGNRPPRRAIAWSIVGILLVTLLIAVLTQPAATGVRMFLRVGLRCLVTSVVCAISAGALLLHGRRIGRLGPKLCALGLTGGAILFGLHAYAFSVGRYTEVAYLGGFEVLVICMIGLGLVLWWKEGLLVDAERTSQELVDRTRALLQAQRMESIGKLASSVAHDFNNVLTVVLGNMDSLLRRPDLTDTARAGLDETRNAAIHAARVTSQLLTLARRPSSSPRVFDLNHEVNQLLPLLRRLAGDRVELRTELAPDALPVRVACGQVEQILLNLVVNSRDAIEGHGVVTIETERIRRASGSEVRLLAKDTGVGMTAAVRDRCGEIFFTTKGDRGTGLGLASIHSILKDTGGTMAIDSAPGQGTTVCLTWPEAETCAERERDLPVVVLPRPTAATILLVEDEVMVRNVTRRALEGSGYHVLAPESSMAAAALLRDEWATFELLLTDVAMPGLSGPELARLARELRPGLCIRFMSGFIDEERQAQLPEDCALLAKPFTRHELLAFVAQALVQPSQTVMATETDS